MYAVQLPSQRLLAPGACLASLAVITSHCVCLDDMTSLGRFHTLISNV